MFNSERIASVGIMRKIDHYLQLTLWALIDNRIKKGIEIDEVQTFDLTIEKKDGIQVQKVIHRQQIPAVSDTYYLPEIKKPVNIKVVATAYEEHCIMMLTDEN